MHLSHREKDILIAILVVVILLVIVYIYLRVKNPDALYKLEDDVGVSNQYSYLMYNNPSKIVTPTSASPTSITDVDLIPSSFMGILMAGVSLGGVTSTANDLVLYSPATKTASATTAAAVAYMDDPSATTTTALTATCVEYSASDSSLYYVSGGTLYSYNISSAGVSPSKTTTPTKVASTFSGTSLAISSDGAHVAMLTSSGLVFTSLSGLSTTAGTNVISIDNSVALTDLEFSASNMLYALDGKGNLYVLVGDESKAQFALNPMNLGNLGSNVSVISCDKANDVLYAMVPSAGAASTATVYIVEGITAAFKSALNSTSATASSSSAVKLTKLTDTSNLTMGMTDMAFL